MHLYQPWESLSLLGWWMEEACLPTPWLWWRDWCGSLLLFSCIKSLSWIPLSCIWLMYGQGLCSLLSNVWTAIWILLLSGILVCEVLCFLEHFQVELTKKVTAQVKLLCKAEEERLASTALDEELPPYDQARALGKTNMDVDRIAAGLPCGSEGFLLMFARWKKLERDIFNERKEWVVLSWNCPISSQVWQKEQRFEGLVNGLWDSESVTPDHPMWRRLQFLS